VQAWRPYLKKDIELMEGVQKRATKLVPSVRKYSYEERLKFFNLTTLETRRIRGDLIEVFKIFKGI
jgi:ribonucleases P/MRP protein subunit RPP40